MPSVYSHELTAATHRSLTRGAWRHPRDHLLNPLNYKDEKNWDREGCWLIQGYPGWWCRNLVQISVLMSALTYLTQIRENTLSTWSVNLNWSPILPWTICWALHVQRWIRWILTVKLAGFWRVRHVIRCITVDCVKCYNTDMDKMLRNHWGGTLQTVYCSAFVMSLQVSLDISSKTTMVRGDMSHNLLWTWQKWPDCSRWY